MSPLKRCRDWIDHGPRDRRLARLRDGSTSRAPVRDIGLRNVGVAIHEEPGVARQKARD